MSDFIHPLKQDLQEARAKIGCAPPKLEPQKNSLKLPLNGRNDTNWFFYFADPHCREPKNFIRVVRMRHPFSMTQPFV